MFKQMVVLMATAGFVLAGSQSASAFLAGQSSVIAASQELDNSVQVKKKFKFKKAKGDPPGWSRGRKTGWGGLGMPPGQAKKIYGW
jgi:hypothetical protein